MADCNSCPSKGTCGNDSGTCGVECNPKNKVKHIIGVMSGKGGVGKSTVSVMIAKQLCAQGYKVGVLDADITGPSVARLMGLNGKRAYGMDGMIIPVEAEDGIKVISLNLMLEDENQPVIWRGSLLSNCVKQFWVDTFWDELDYLIIDMPPGTGDVTLTVMQSIPISGMVMVSIPQDMVNMIVTKSINMAKKMNVPIYGIVENMSYVACPCCNTKIKIYQGDTTEKFLKENDIKLLGELPTNSSLSAISGGVYEQVDGEIAEIFKNITDEVIRKSEVSDGNK